MSPYTYLLINFLTVIICFIASFDSRIKFNRHFGAYSKAAALTAMPFIAWDVWFTKTGVWWFNTNYTLGFTILGLPLEECLFFFCIPFSCVFTYFCLDKFFNLSWANKYNKFLALTTIVVCLLIAVLFHNKIYPFVTALVAAFIMIYLYYVEKADWIGKASFAFLVLMPGFFLVNGILTGTGLESPIVNYNPEHILNIRLLTIPIEDTVYGYAQFMIVVSLFSNFKEK
ncbi:MAG: lycopene cyclase domain-containing protein [Cyclobacteriaceae bacterium]|nr:lycopene cyclase domain-containing protein [Cyclobacteriaceae bacterium]